MKLYIYTLLLMILSASGCVTFTGDDGTAARKIIDSISGEPVIPRDANRILISNMSGPAGNQVITGKLAIRLKDFIIRDGRLAPVSDGSMADITLTGIITHYQVQPIEYGAQREPVKKRLWITVKVTLHDNKRHKDIFRESDVQSFEVFSDTVPPISTEYQVQDMVLDNLAKRISLKTITGWYTDLMTPIEKDKR